MPRGEDQRAFRLSPLMRCTQGPCVRGPDLQMLVESLEWAGPHETLKRQPRGQEVISKGKFNTTVRATVTKSGSSLICNKSHCHL